MRYTKLIKTGLQEVVKAVLMRYKICMSMLQRFLKRINVIRNGKRKFAKCRLANFQIKLRNILPGRWMCCMTNMDLPVM